MTRDEIVSFWGRDRLRRWSTGTLEKLAIGESAKSFLSEVGLPLCAARTIRADTGSDQLPALPGFGNLRRIAIVEDRPICIDESRGAIVVLVEATQQLAIDVNSDVECFGEFLTYYEKYRKSVQHFSDEQAQELAELTAKRMRRSDIKAFADERSFWSEIVEEMLAGF